MPIRSCVGCRKRWPITELVGLARHGDAWVLVRLAGTPVQAEVAAGQPDARTMPIDGRMLVNGEDVTEGVRDRAAVPGPDPGRRGTTKAVGKGWSVCPTAKCLERALRAKAAEARSRAEKARAREAQAGTGAGVAATGGAVDGRGDGRRNPKKGNRDRAAGTLGVGDDVTQVLEQATLVVARCIQLRREGLRRRRVPVTGDARLDAWEKLADRMRAERAGR